MTARPVPAGGRVSGEVRVPPSKSVTNRALNLALLARRPLTVVRPLESEDIAVFVRALEATGSSVERGGDALKITPGPTPGGGEIDCRASGTMARFLTASLATLPGSWRLDGTERLRERPVGAVVEALRSLGARVECRGDEGFLPLQIEGGPLAGGEVALEAGESSQFASALLMAATSASGALTIRIGRLVSAPYVDLTLAVMEEFGARVGRSGSGALTVRPGLAPPEIYRVEADFSSACYFAAAAALTAGRVELAGIRERSRQGDRRFLELLTRMGATVDWPASDRAIVTGGEGLSGVDEDMSEMPDQVPTLAAVAPFARGVTRIRNVAHLRIKESDRLAACTAELLRLGAAVEESRDGLTIPGVWAADEAPVTPVRVAAHDDHRIAMSFALTGLRRPGVEIERPGVVAKSYPGFWEDLESCLRP